MSGDERYAEFSAKPKLDTFEEIPQWLEDKIDRNGFVTGYYVDGFIVGDVVEANDEYITFESWIPVEKDTLINRARQSDWGWEEQALRGGMM